jgi:hypothetical protein
MSPGESSQISGIDRPTRRYSLGRSTAVTLGLTIVVGGALGAFFRRAGPSRPKMASVAPASPSARPLPKAACGVALAEVPPEIVKDSRSAAYDPQPLVRIGVSGREIFNSEVRNDRWAGAMERSVGGSLLGDLARLVPAAKDVSIECRTWTCLISWAASDVAHDNLVRQALRLGAVSPSSQMAAAENGRSGMLLFFSPPDRLKEQYGDRFSDFDTSNPERYSDVYEARRRELFSQIRSGSRTLPKGLDLANLP